MHRLRLVASHHLFLFLRGSVSLCLRGPRSSPRICQVEKCAVEKSRVRATEGQTGSAPERSQGQKPEGRGSETCKYLGMESPGHRA